MPNEVVDNPAESRYEIRVDGELAGFADYRLLPGKIIFTHTEVRPEHEGKGLAAALVSHALRASKAAGQRVVPRCPYVKSYIERHPEFQDLVGEPTS
ncbi:N-acetyltransferase [Nonomuraea sp. NN258]|uniref:GNAT family N-acetyltransferase n=1 Tax=Nonomuraea antri TaxID=2730852 RepID=UPI00156966A7|nr:GNAT family N-acetyltransferase [Nonomuraea antri]NRQ35546.1 N-acetyltransferase [Nonomuraea antri]